MRFRVLALLLLIVSSQPVRAQWTWRYPQPQGHTLNDIVFLDNTTAIAVGEFGTVMVTHDAGDSWVVKWNVGGITSALLSIDRLDASSAVTVGENGVILRTVDQGVTWTPMPSGTASALRDESFADATHGVAVAGLTVLRTSNGGLSWQSAAVSTSMQAVDMTSPTDAVASGDLGTVLYSGDGGATWSPGASPVPPGYQVSLTALDFLDALHGAVAAASGVDTYGAPVTSVWYVTDDGGATWAPLTPFSSYSTNIVYIPRELLYPDLGRIQAACRWECCITSALDPWPTGDLIVSEDAGAHWTHRAMSRSANGLARNNDGVVITVGEDGILLRRDTAGIVVKLGGAPQNHQAGGGASSFADAFTGMVMSSDDYMYGNGDSHFARTSDGGQTWAVTNVANVECFDLAHASSSDVYAVGVDISGTHASVLRSTNGGATWSQAWSSASITRLNAIATSSATHAVAVGSGGGAVVIDNGAVTPVSTGTTASLGDVAFATPLVAVAVSGSTTMRRSMDGGLTWGPMTGSTPPIRALDFATATTGCGIASAGIYRTNDAGSTWTAVPSGALSDLRAIDFADANHGMAVGNVGLVLVTSDGGNTWAPVDGPTGRDLNDVTLLSSGHGIASGLQQILFEYGEAPVPTLISGLNVAPRPFAAELRWSVSNDANLTGFNIRRRDGAVEKAVADQLSSNARTFLDEGLVPGRTYEYHLLAIDGDGAITQSAPVSVTIPAATVQLFPNQPNPFNPATTIRFVLPERSRARLMIYDIAGRHVVTLLDEVRNAGLQAVEWNGVNARGESVASGVYVSRLEVGKEHATRKMVLLK